MKKKSVTAREKFRSLALVELNAQEILPGKTDLQNFNYMRKAADVVDNIFWQQVLPDIDPSSLLKQAGDDQELKEILLFNRGPYDRLNDDAPLLPIAPKLPGVGFYPPDLTREEFINFVKTHPDSKPLFESPYTVIKRGDSGLVAIPYHEAYGEQVTYLSEILTRMSETERHPQFQQFLAQRARDFLTDNYFVSDRLWVQLSDNPLDLVIGPYEVYEDQLVGLKAAYEAMVLARDFEESDKIRRFQQELPSLSRSLEPDLGKSLNIEDSRAELSVFSLIYSGGDASKGIPAIAFSLPNDERVIEEVGARQVILKNVLEAKFHSVVWPIHKLLLQTPLDNEKAAFQSFLNHTLFHEISHSLGPHRITKNGESTTVNRSLKQYHTVLEETKADSLGACLVMNSEGSEVRTFLETYVAGFLRSIRFGLTRAHGGANAIQFNYLLHEGAIVVDDNAGRLSINQHKARRAIIKLASNIIDIQERGDFEAANRFVTTFCVMNSQIEELIRRVSGIPLDIRIRYEA